MPGHRQAQGAYKQLLDNTNLEICACNEKGEFLRVQGTANFDNTPEAQAAAFKIMPQLADMYNEETGLKLGIIYLDTCPPSCSPCPAV